MSIDSGLIMTHNDTACYSRMFFTAWGSKATIETASLAGRGRRAIITEDLQKPHGLTLELHNNEYSSRLYSISIFIQGGNKNHQEI